LDRKKVLISFPNTGWIHKLVFIAATKLLSDNRYQSTLIVPTHNPYENNLHHIRNDFIKGGYDYWLNIDASGLGMRTYISMCRRKTLTLNGLIK
jgi:hypothetical protein